MHGYEELNAKINRLKNGGGMGYSDTKTLCYDGKQMGTDVLEDGNLYVKVSADPLNLDGFQSVTLSSKSGGSLSYGKSQVAIGTEDGITAVAIDNLTYLLAFVVADENVGIEVGTYFYSGEDTYVSAIKTETIHPISDKYLPEGFGGGSVATIDLAQYADKNFYGQSIAKELLSMVAQSLGASGALQTKTAAFNDSSLFDALSTTQQVVASLDMGDDTILRFNPVASCLGGGKAQLYSFSALMMQGYTVYELKALFFFTDNTGTEMEIHVQAKPVA